jgi:hypothetical protein
LSEETRVPEKTIIKLYAHKVASSFYNNNILLDATVPISVKNIQKKKKGLDPISKFNLPHFYACPKPEPGYPSPYVNVFFVMNHLR